MSPIINGPSTDRRLLIGFIAAIVLGVFGAAFGLVQFDNERQRRLDHLCSVAEENRAIWRDVAGEVERSTPAAVDLSNYIRERVAVAEQRAPVQCPDHH